MFKKWRKRRACEHDYYLVRRFRYWTGREYVSYVRAYCPKCEHEYYESESNWEASLAKQRLRQAYLRREKDALEDIERLRDS